MHYSCYLDPRTRQCELEVQKFIDLQRIANKLPNVFLDTKRITTSYMPAKNASIQLMSLLDNHTPEVWRPISSKIKNPWNRRKANDFIEANDSNGNTLPNEEDKDIVSIFIVIQNFWHN